VVRRQIRFGWWNVAALAPVVFVALFTVLALQGTSRAIEEMSDIERGYELIRTLDRLQVLVQDAERAQRGFLLTGDSTFLRPLIEVRHEVRGLVSSVRVLLGDSDAVVELAGLVPMIERRLDLIFRTIELRGNGASNASLVGAESVEGLLLMAEIRRRIDGIEQTQLARFADRLALRTSNANRLVAALLIGSVTTILLAWLLNGALLRYAREQRALGSKLDEKNTELEEKNLELEDQALELEQQAAELEAQTVELEEALEDVRENEELFRALTENAPDLIAVVDSEGRAVYQSPSAARLLGVPPEQLTGTSLIEILHPEDRHAALSEFERIRRDPERLARFDTRVRDGEGGWRHLAVTARLLPTPLSLSGIVVNAQDVTEAKRLEEQFRHAQRMEAVGRLAGGVAHDFSNILGIIKGNVQLLQLDLETESSLYSELQLVNDACDRAASLVHQLLAYSRKQILQPKLIDLNELVVETEKMLRRVIGSDIRLRTNLDPHLGRVNADPGQMQQVLLNLAVNARDAMPNGGDLVIETRNVRIAEGAEELFPHLPVGSHAVLLSVSDTGTGIEHEIQKHIFEPFFSTKEQGKGTGLGLSTVYGIVKQSRGYIWVYSEPGEGTVFKIQLPRVDLRAEPRPKKMHLRTVHGSGNILLVEDDAQLRRVMRRLLERGGYTVWEAADGVEALRICEERGALLDLLVTDMVMPQMSGTELARHAHSALPELRILFVSGHTDDTLIRTGRLPVGASFVQKPVDSAEFLRTVSSLMGKVDTSGGEERLAR
jgi:two-component system, cell cycle sensor histidine kinase and response regulator CckA